ncbi:hypothetical protein Taro_007357 [Colocasia esculenta]|uniref:Secreted protein n=1 Tax=Colocasia esculenta TaxID=4460 RepID=A0A843U021_COLES|nr:hypothetical protein [Colocasia esculenta]
MVMSTFVSSMGCLCLHWMLTWFDGYTCVNDGVFVPPSDNMPLRMSFHDTGGLKHVPLCVSFYDTGGLKHVPLRVSFYDTGGLKHVPLRVSFYDTGGLKHVALRVSFYDTGGLKHPPFAGSVRKRVGLSACLCFLGHPGRFLALWDIPVIWLSRTSRPFFWLYGTFLSFGFLGHPDRFLALRDIPVIW